MRNRPSPRLPCSSPTTHSTHSTVTGLPRANARPNWRRRGLQKLDARPLPKRSGAFRRWRTGHLTADKRLRSSSMYNPTIGRFMTRDPFAELGGLNLYEYADNDPVNKTDPTGLAAETTTDGPNAEIEEQLALEGAMNLAWLQDEYEGWTFTPFPGGYTGIDSRGRQMTFDSELNQTGYASGRRQFRLEYRDDGSVVRAWMDL